MRTLLCVCVLLALAWMATPAIAQDEPYPDVQWTELFNGTDLTGWALAEGNGQAKYEVKDGAVVGTTVVNTPNSFLKSARMYGDFVLEYEFKVAEGMNSGVQIRSHNFPEHAKGRVHGYQIEIDPSERAWTAGVYDEARRGWLNDLKNKPEAGAAFKHEDWNKIRVVFVGDHLQTWINGVAAADLQDSLTPAGFIYLQVHSVGKDEKKAGHQVMWRNLRIKDLDRVKMQRGAEGTYKGAISTYSKGLWAKVEKSGEETVAKLYDSAAMSGAPVAELKGKQDGRTVKFEGGDWSGQISRGMFTGKGKAPELKASKDGKMEPTGKTVEASFEMMKGAVQAEK